jgi:hypothetical protein
MKFGLAPQTQRTFNVKSLSSRGFWPARKAHARRSATRVTPLRRVDAIQPDIIDPSGRELQ